MIAVIIIVAIKSVRIESEIIIQKPREPTNEFDCVWLSFGEALDEALEDSLVTNEFVDDVVDDDWILVDDVVDDDADDDWIAVDDSVVTSGGVDDDAVDDWIAVDDSVVKSGVVDVVDDDAVDWILVDDSVVTIGVVDDAAIDDSVDDSVVVVIFFMYWLKSLGNMHLLPKHLIQIEIRKWKESYQKISNSILITFPWPPPLGNGHSVPGGK